MTRILLIIATVVSLVVVWSTIKVCQYNEKLRQEVNNINELNKKELNIEGEARIRYFKSINCNISFVKENYNLETLIKKINELLPKNIENIKKNFN